SEVREHEDDQYCYQDRNSSCKKDSQSTSIYITLYIFFSLISVFTAFLNLLVIISISLFKHLHTPTNLLILSLAVTDLLVGLIVIPAMTVAIMQPCWLFGEYFCTLLLYVTFLCASLSLGNLILISVDRYVAVCDPLLYHTKVTIARMKYCIFITWCCCVTYVVVFINITVKVYVPRCFEECYFGEGDIWITMMDLIFTVVMPYSIIMTLYFKIFLVARSQARQVFSKGVASVSGVKTVQTGISKGKAEKTLGIVVFNYLVCWNPFFYLFYFFSGSYLASAIFSFLPLINSLINPIIYAFFYPWFKLTAKRILTLKLSYLL
uniref:G-protein coupled receptors family 1 profile domain-containing protein n=1 Tax=Esox lucius TaxID=8010 RepID=A0AAY5KG43_ESOLU